MILAFLGSGGVLVVCDLTPVLRVWGWYKTKFCCILAFLGEFPCLGTDFVVC